MGALDYAILIIAIALIVAVGIRSAGGSGDSREFLLANKGISKFQAGLSMAATDFGGSGLVAAVGYCYVVGMSGIWWNLAAAPAFLLVGLFLADKFNRMDSATLPEYLGKRYSPFVKYISTVMHIMTNIAALSVQFTVSCAVLYTITGFSMNVSLVISVLLVIFLTSGGLKAVVNTDATLFIIIVISVVLIAPIAVTRVGGIGSISQAVPEGFMSIGQLGFWTPFSWFMLCLLSYSTNQNYIQRMVAAKNEGTARFGACFTAGFYLVISILIGLIGISAYLLIPGLEDTNTVFPEILRGYMPAGLLGLGVAGVFAATISTGTSVLHATVTLVVNDLYVPLIAKKDSESRIVTVSRIILVVIALFSMLISIFNSNIINVLYVSGLFYGVSVFIPMILGMYSRKTTALGASVSIVVTVVFALTWEYLLASRIPVIGAVPSNIMGLVISLITILAVSAADKRGRTQK